LRLHFESAPVTSLAPPDEAIVAGGALAIKLEQIAPWRTRPQDPENAVLHAPAINARPALRLAGQQLLYHPQREVGQVISAHAGRQSEMSHPENPDYNFMTQMKLVGTEQF
jgi:hypothetical protein